MSLPPFIVLHRFALSCLGVAALNVFAVEPTALPASITEVHAPIRVGTPPTDAIAGLVRLENGEIRHYDCGDQVSIELHNHPRYLAENYIASRDNGLTWESKTVPSGHLGADARSPISGEYLRLVPNRDGLHLLKSKGGIDGEWTERNVYPVTLRAPDLNNTRPIVFIRDGKRALVPFCTMKRFPPDFGDHVGALYSNDDGETWKQSNLIEGPPHEPNERDKSVRWQNGGYEPTLVELRDGRVWMIFRTSTDYHYQSFSTDGGTTWSTPEPSPFYGTITTPTIGRLKDGRLLFLWNNTLPLPEFPKNEITAPYLGSANTGAGEDMFNNRDAIHAAISSDDGKTWKGFRELYLNVRRNDGNYAETWGIDRSVHQSQFVEVDAGRVLVSLGQHWLHRSLVLFDPAWLEETERHSDFTAYGLSNWSVQGFYNGIRGHCALNRFASAVLVKHPDDATKQVLEIHHVNDPRAMFPIGGATWNFPAGRTGSVETRLRLNASFGGGRISLLDRWVNPTDPTAHTIAMCHVDIAADGTTNAGFSLKAKEWHTLRLQWQGIDKGAKCVIALDGKPVGEPFLVQRPANHGVSYVHYQSTATERDGGFMIESVAARVDP